MSNEAHFYIDHAPPDGVRRILGILSLQSGLSVREIGEAVPSSGQARFRSEWPRRLYGLGLSDVASTRPLTYKLTPLGAHIRQLSLADSAIINDLMHYLHSDWSGTSQHTHSIWSYLVCSQIAWRERRFLGRKQTATLVMERMRECFAGLNYTARIGARFDSTAVGRWFQWVQALEPAPFTENGGVLCRRTVARHELALLGLDRTYRVRGYRYGDPVLLDDALLDEIAAVFFLDLSCCRQLIDTAARLTRAIRLSDTFAGTSITLLEPYTIERI